MSLTSGAIASTHRGQPRPSDVSTGLPRSVFDQKSGFDEESSNHWIIEDGRSMETAMTWLAVKIGAKIWNVLKVR